MMPWCEALSKAFSRLNRTHPVYWFLLKPSGISWSYLTMWSWQLVWSDNVVLAACLIWECTLLDDKDKHYGLEVHFINSSHTVVMQRASKIGPLSIRVKESRELCVVQAYLFVTKKSINQEVKQLEEKLQSFRTDMGQLKLDFKNLENIQEESNLQVKKLDELIEK